VYWHKRPSEKKKAEMKLSNFLKKANSVLNRLDLILPDEAGKTDWRALAYRWHSVGKKGILEEEKLYDNNNQLRQRVLYEYNSEKQHLIKEKHVSLGGNFLNINNLKFDNITEYTYDSNGNIIEKYGRNDKNNYDLYDYRYDYKYDDKGNWIQCIETQKDGSKIIREREIRYRK